MSKGIGRLLQFGIAKESTRGTTPGSATFWLPFFEFDLYDKNELVKDEASVGVVEGSVDAKIIREWAEGNLRAPIGDKHFPLVLYAILGSLSTADNPDTDPTVKDHTITVGQSAQHQSLSFYIDDPLGGQDRTHALGMVDQLEIEYQQGQFLQYNATLKAKKSATATLTPATTSENKFLPQHFTFKLAATQAGLDAAGATTIKSLTLRITQEVEHDDVLGNKEPADFLNKSFRVEGTIEAMWQNETDFRNAWAAGTVQAMRLDLKNTDVTIGAAANPEIKIDLHAVTFRELTRPVRIGDLVMQTLAFDAHYKTADSKMIQVVATNVQASY